MISWLCCISFAMTLRKNSSVIVGERERYYKLGHYLHLDSNHVPSEIHFKLLTFKSITLLASRLSPLLPKYSYTKFKMYKSLLPLATLLSLSQAVVIDIYNDASCNDLKTAGVNIYDNSCALWPGGFQSYKITAHGWADFQCLYTWSQASCAGTSITTQSANKAPLNVCIQSTDENGGSNAIASYSGAGQC